MFVLYLRVKAINDSDVIISNEIHEVFFQNLFEASSGEFEVTIPEFITPVNPTGSLLDRYEVNLSFIDVLGNIQDVDFSSFEVSLIQ